MFAFARRPLGSEVAVGHKEFSEIQEWAGVFEKCTRRVLESFRESQGTGPSWRSNAVLLFTTGKAPAGFGF